MNTPTSLPFREADFRKATASNPDKDCVRVARQGDRVELRDDKKTFGAPDDTRLIFTAAEFDHYQAEIRAGLSGERIVTVVRRPDGDYVFRKTGAVRGAAELVFTETELAAFHSGVQAREFDELAYA
ncbi:DUF397 domain-containing protein [Amycolatopsis pittospori]|uniref:DUF397 domain-containing protein n=1 Tax=Amycolatopsis pittospori TaxID=2749434 RepID=UPI0015F0E436|nr:DUF397 domain-containing protein [Amycolatopsis pittospori]